jgi:hypothetical protein
LDFSTISYGFSKLTDLNWGVLIFYRTLERFKSLQSGPWLGYTGMPISGDQIPERALTNGEGEVGEKVQGLTAVTGVAGVGEERDRGGRSTANKGGRWCSEGRRRCFGGRRVGGQWGSS